MNIIVVNDYSYVNGGAGKIAIETAVLLAEYGHQVTLFTAVGPIDERLKKINNLTIICLQQQDILHDHNRLRAMINGVWNRKVKTKFAELLDAFDNQNTIVHVHTCSKALSSSCVYIAKKKKYPVLYHLHDYGIVCPNMAFYNYKGNRICKYEPLSMQCVFSNCDSRSYLHKLWRLVRQFVQRKWGGIPHKIDGYIYISKFSFNILKKFIYTEKTYFLPNPIELKNNKRIEVEKNKYFVFVGRLNPEKNPALLAKAGATLGVQVVFVGDGSCFNDVKQNCPSAIMTGWVNEDLVDFWMRKARAIVFPSVWYEGQPLVVLEALARGIPVITSDCCAAMDMVRHRETGLFFKSNDCTDLVSMMEILLNDEVAIQYSKTAFEESKKNDNGRRQYVKNLEKIYIDLLKGTK